MPYDDPNLKEFDDYYQARSASKRERAENWAVAIGLQKVDGLTPSRYLIDVAKRHIEGDISGAAATRMIDRYYETKSGHDAPEDVKEADRVSARINEVIEEEGFNLSPTCLIGLHGLIFEGVFPHAGSIREVNLRKREWVLRGDSVTYGHAPMIEKTLEYDFDREREFSYANKGKKEIVSHFARFISGIWQIHPFREGNTRTVALFAIKYLRSRGYSVTNDLFAEKSWYFRNALVRANYENDRLGVEKTQLPLEEFFKVLIYGDEIELHNRFLRIGQEYGTTTAKAIADLHRHDNVVNRPDVGINRRNDGINDGINSSNDVINDVINGVIKFTEKEEIAVKALVRDPRLSAARLADLIGVKQRQAQRIITSLKNKAGLKRRGARKNGEWYFEGVAK